MLQGEVLPGVFTKNCSCSQESKLCFSRGKGIENSLAGVFQQLGVMKFIRGN